MARLNTCDNDTYQILKHSNTTRPEYYYKNSQYKDRVYYSEYVWMEYNNMKAEYTLVLKHSYFKGYKIADNQLCYSDGITHKDMLTVINELDWQKRGLSYTSTGYGAKIPTRYKVFHRGRFYRVYCTIYSNSGSLWIKVMDNKIFLH